MRHVQRPDGPWPQFAFKLAPHGALIISKPLGHLQKRAGSVQHLGPVKADQRLFGLEFGSIDHQPVHRDPGQRELGIGGMWRKPFVVLPVPGHVDGLASALTDPDVQRAILAQPGHPVHLAVYEWSGPVYQRLLLDWTAIRDSDSLLRISVRLAAAERHPAPPGTALGNAMRFGAGLLAGGPDCRKRTLDISGDGKSNFGPHPRDIRMTLSATDLTLNALVIGADAPETGNTRQVELTELSAYFNAWVITGPGAFVETANGFEEYQSAMTRKLLRELETLTISSLEPGTTTDPVTLP